MIQSLCVRKGLQGKLSHCFYVKSTHWSTQSLVFLNISSSNTVVHAKALGYTITYYLQTQDLHLQAQQDVANPYLKISIIDLSSPTKAEAAQRTLEKMHHNKYQKYSLNIVNESNIKDYMKVMNQSFFLNCIITTSGSKTNQLCCISILQVYTRFPTITGYV